MKNLLYFLIILALITACSSVTVVPYKNVQEIKNSTLIYTLPKQKIQVHTQLVRTSYQCGPYNRFAKKYLGIDNQFTEHTVLWRISDLNFETISIPDTTQSYAILNARKALQGQLNFSRDGRLLSVNKISEGKIKGGKSTIVNLKHEDKEKNMFTDLSVKKILVTKIDTIYKRVRSDSGFVKVPQINDIIVNKNLEEKAEEIANQIFDIRDEKIAILSGDYKSTITGDAVRAFVEELNKLEEKYISLFTTVVKRDTFAYTFEYEPNPDLSKTSVLCYFSERKGISFIQDSINIPISIESGRTGNSWEITQLIKNNTKKPVKYNGYFFRIPEYGEVRLYFGKELLGKRVMLISQFGAVMALPVEFMKEKNLQIEFDAETGALLNLSKMSGGKFRK